MIRREALTSVMLSVIVKKIAGVAQLVEQLICNQLAAGSNPVTSLDRDIDMCLVLYFQLF